MCTECVGGLLFSDLKILTKQLISNSKKALLIPLSHKKSFMGSHRRDKRVTCSTKKFNIEFIPGLSGLGESGQSISFFLRDGPKHILRHSSLRFQLVVSLFCLFDVFLAQYTCAFGENCFRQRHKMNFLLEMQVSMFDMQLVKM